MKFCAYMVICLCLPFALLAEDDEKAAAKEPQAADASAADAPAESADAVTDPGFERFKTILDRMPFGRPPPGFNPDAPSGPVEGRRGGADDPETEAEIEASEVEQQILSSVRVSMLNRTPEGKVFVGFTDSSVQPARNYLLELGEKREQCEWLVVAVDPDNRQVTLSKGGVEATLNVGGGGASSGDKKAKEGEDGEKAAGRPGPARGRALPLPTVAGGKLSGLEIARARREARLAKQQAEEEQQRQAAEQLKKDREQAAQEREQAAQERKAQMDQLLQIRDEIRRQREEKEAARRSEDESEAPQQGEQEPVEE